MCVVGRRTPQFDSQPMRWAQLAPSGPRSQSRQLKTLFGVRAVVSFQLNRRLKMKPNGKRSVVRVVMFALCAAGLFSVAAQAQTARGTFKLPVEARWGTMILAPGEYGFT